MLLAEPEICTTSETVYVEAVGRRHNREIGSLDVPVTARLKSDVPRRQPHVVECELPLAARIVLFRSCHVCSVTENVRAIVPLLEVVEVSRRVDEEFTTSNAEEHVSVSTGTALIRCDEAQLEPRDR